MVNTFVDDYAPERLICIERPILVDQLEVDKELRARASMLIGAVAIDSVVEVEPHNEPAMTLAEACRQASEGNGEALEMVRMNVRTDYFERAYKSGHVTRVRLEEGPEGDLTQHGQRLLDTHLNSIKYLGPPILRERARIEAINGVRIEYLRQAGLLKDTTAVTFSLVPRKIPEEKASELGFFTDTMSLAAQLMTDDDGIVIDTVFLAGRDSASEDRRDEEIVKHFVAQIGLDFSAYDADEMLEHIVLIPKDVMKDTATFIEMFDASAESVRSEKMFFGRVADGKKDYVAHIAECRKREEQMQAETEATVKELLASSHMFQSPIDATELLDKLNDKLLKKRIVSDSSIEANVLGQQVAFYVNHARNLAEQGIQNAQLMILQNKINKEGRSSSCPNGGQNKDGQSAEPWEALFGEKNQPKESSEETLEDCEFISKECPKCGAKNVKTECRKGKYYGACGCVG